MKQLLLSLVVLLIPQFVFAQDSSQDKASSEVQSESVAEKKKSTDVFFIFDNEGNKILMVLGSDGEWYPIRPGHYDPKANMSHKDASSSNAQQSTHKGFYESYFCPAVMFVVRAIPILIGVVQIASMVSSLKGSSGMDVVEPVVSAEDQILFDRFEALTR